MSKTIFILLLLLNAPSLKAETAPCLEFETPSKKDTHNAASFAERIAVIAEKLSDDEKVKVETADLYLKSVGMKNNFDDNEMNNYIKTLTPICENKELEKKLRSKSCANLSGLHGALARKLQLSGIANGLSAYKYIKAAITIDPYNSEAVFGHAMAVQGMSEQNYFVKKMVESKLGVSISAEAKEAEANLKRVKLDWNPLYQKIREIK